MTNIPYYSYSCFLSRKIDYSIVINKKSNFFIDNNNWDRRYLQFYQGNGTYHIDDNIWISQQGNPINPISYPSYYKIPYIRLFINNQNTIISETYDFNRMKEISVTINGNGLALNSCDSISSTNYLFNFFAWDYTFNNTNENLLVFATNNNDLDINFSNLPNSANGVSDWNAHIEFYNIGNYSYSCQAKEIKGSFTKLALLEWLEIQIGIDYIELNKVVWYKYALDIIDFQNTLLSFGLDLLPGIEIDFQNIPTYKDFKIGRELIKRINFASNECDKPVVSIYCGGDSCPDDFCKISCNEVECCYDPITGELIGNKSPLKTVSAYGVIVNFY